MFMRRNWINCLIFFLKIKKRGHMLAAAHDLRKCSKDFGFHDQKATRGSKCIAVTEKLTPSEVKFKQKISYFYGPIISKRSRLDSDVVVKAGTVTLSDNHSDCGPSQCSSKNWPFRLMTKIYIYTIIVPNSQTSLLSATKSLTLL